MIRISNVMTPAVHTIGLDRTLEQALDLMNTHGIRHLPVLQGGKLCGMVTLRDVNLIGGPGGADPSETPVEEAMSQDVFAVEPTASLAEVCSTMARRKLGAAIVAHEGKVEGIFTTVDACRALSELLRGGPGKETASKKAAPAAKKPAAPAAKTKAAPAAKKKAAPAAKKKAPAKKPRG